MQDFCQVKKLVKLYVTPSLLRAWADGMERKWPRLTLGESIIWRDIYIDESTELHLCFDQDKMHKEYKHA